MKNQVYYYIDDTNEDHIPAVRWYDRRNRQWYVAPYDAFLTSAANTGHALSDWGTCQRISGDRVKPYRSADWNGKWYLMHS